MLWGRAAELAFVSHHVLRSAPVLVAGAAGVGKTALVRAAAAATTATRPVFRGGGLAALSSVEYLPVIRALDQELGGDPAAVAEEVRRRVANGVLILDDLQWADAATLATLPLLAGHVRLIAAARRGDRDFGRAHAAVDFEVLELQPLRDADARKLAHAANDSLDARELTYICRRGGGNPLLLFELASGGPSRLFELTFAARLARASVEVRSALVRLAVHQPAAASLIGDCCAELVAGAFAIERDGMLELPHHRLASIVLSAGARGNGGAAAGDTLTTREREVLRLVREGLTSGEVAVVLGIGRATVDSHIRSAMHKLGARSRAQAALLFERA